MEYINIYLDPFDVEKLLKYKDAKWNAPVPLTEVDTNNLPPLGYIGPFAIYSKPKESK